MDGSRLYSIGELARRTGLTVKAVRFYAERGIVPPTDRDANGYRRYDIDAVACLDLVRTLRDLGLDLATIKKVVNREISLPDVAAAHVEALTAQLRLLRLRRAVLAVVARRGSNPEEMALMHKLAKLAEDERRALVGDFLDSAFGGVADQPAFVGVVRSMTPELPADPDSEQVEAWVELAELLQDPDFRTSVRDMAHHHAAQRVGGDVVRRDALGSVCVEVVPAVTAGVEPASAEADSVVAAVLGDYPDASDDGAGRRGLVDLLTLLEMANDPRRERYLELLAVINGWSAPHSVAPLFDWFIRALRARISG